jgi:2'-5' RNA ligase
MAAVRTFIAIMLDGSLHNTLTEVVEKFASSKASVKWVAPENTHVTLKFLGNVDEARLEEVYTACERATEGFGPIELEMKAVGCFPTMNRPKIVWLGIERGTDLVKEIQQSIESELELAGFPSEQREFTAHLTIGRVKGKEGISNLCRLLEEDRNVFIGSMRAEKISVMKSKTTPAGAIYTELKSIPLKQ